MTANTVLLTDFSSSVARITLNRPGAMNALDASLGRALADAAERCAEEQSVRSVLLFGEGRLFSAGGDLGFLSKAGGDAAYELITNLHRAVIAFARMPSPLVVAAKTSAGAGLSLVAGADYVVAADNAKFTSAYTGAGLSPDGGLSYFLPRLIGRRLAQRMIFSNAPLMAAEALAAGLVDEVVAADELESKALEVAKRFAQGPRRAFAQVRRLLGGSIDALKAHLDAERDALVSQLESNEGQEGIAAFFERRPPRFE